MTEFNTDPIRKTVLESDNPLRSAAATIGAMIDVLVGRYGHSAASHVLHTLMEAVDEQAKPPEPKPKPDYTVTDL